MRTFLYVFALLALLLTATSLPAQTPAFDRAIVCGSGPGLYGGGPSQLAVDASGNTYVAGRFSGTITLGSTTLTAAATSGGGVDDMADIFVAKLNPAGQYVWATLLSGTLNEEVTGLAVDAGGNVVISGWFESYSVAFGNGASTLFNSSGRQEAYVARLDGTSGLWLWARRFGGTNHDQATSVAVTAQGDTYVAGWGYSATADFGSIVLQNAQFGDAYLAKLDASGQWVWARRLATNRPYVSKIVIDSQGELILAGNCQDPTTSFGPFVLATQVIPGTGSLTGSDVFVAKCTDAGMWRWAVQGNSAGQNLAYCESMSYDSRGHVYVAGSYVTASMRIGSTVLPNQSSMVPQPNPLPPVPYTNNYYPDAFIARLDATTGTWQWAVRAGGAEGDGIGKIVSDIQGRVFVAGIYTGRPGFDNPLPGGGRVQLAQLDGTTGAWRWTMPLAVGVLARGIAADASGRLHVGGFFSNPTAQFGATQLQGAGQGLGTGYLARLSAGPLSMRPTQTHAELTVWPNPAPGRVVQVSGVRAGQLVEVLDVLGRRVAAGQMPIVGALTLALDTSTPAGLYVVRAQGNARQIILE